MDNYLETVLNRYVIATLDTPTNYLIFKNDNISFTQFIQRATKTASKTTAETIKSDFYACTGKTDIDLIVLPIQISYELIRDDSTIEGDVIEMLP